MSTAEVLEKQNDYVYTVPRETYKALLKYLGSEEVAEHLVLALEDGIHVVERLSREMIEDKLEEHTLLIKEDLTSKLVTREVFDLRTGEVLNLIDQVKESFKESFNERIDTLEKSLRGDIEVRTGSLRNELKVRTESLREDLKNSIDFLSNEGKAMEESLRKDMKAGEESLRKDMKAMEESLRASDESLRKDMKAMEESLRKDMKAQFGQLKFQFNVLIGLLLVVLALTNPVFMKLIEKLF